MRLWHEDLLRDLPRPQLLGQHRECAALRGNGWGRRHSTVDYVFKYSPYRLYRYHMLVLKEMQRRNYKPSKEWLNKNYRGKNTQPYENLEEIEISKPIYPEHNDAYMKECLENLKDKGINLEL